MRIASLPKRPGFTLIELLIVIAIIGLLMTLAVGAVMKVKGTQDKRFSEGTLKKLDSVIRLHWKAVVETADQEYTGLKNDQKSALLALANQDERRARMIYTKLRLKQEFPNTYYQALNPTPPAPAINKTGIVLAPKLEYQKLLQGVPVNNQWPTGNPIDPAKFGQCESSVLLFAALKQSRRGIDAFDAAEQIEPNGVADVTLANGQKTRVFIDPWGTPLRFYAFPYYLDELNQPPYVVNNKFKDELDPEQSFTQKTRVNNATVNWNRSPLGAAFFTQLQIHPVDRDLRYLTPVIASAGPDGDFGDTGRPPSPYMALSGVNATDNLYSFRLRQDGARGD